MRKSRILQDIYPKTMQFSKDIVIHEFDNRHEFTHKLSTEGTYGSKVEEFLDQIKNGPDVDTEMIEEIRNTVRNNLIKRGIITGTVYEGFKYDVDGLILDYAELAAGNPECMMRPIKKYDKWFYELYVNMSIPWSVSNEDIKEGAIRLIETIKALEELNIEIKVNVILASRGMYEDNRDYLLIIPICNHLEYKDYTLLYPYMNGNFLRGPMFQTMHSGDPVKGNLGRATKLDNSVNLWGLDEETLAARVINDLDMGSK